MLLIQIKKGESDQRITNKLKNLGCEDYVNLKTEERLIVLMGNDSKIIPAEVFEALPEVERTIHTSEPYILSSRQFQKEDTIIKTGKIEIGGSKLVMMAGPCAIESEKQIYECAKAVKKYGCQILRAGAFKPRTSPYTFQGLRKKGLELLAKAGEKEDLLTVTEVMSLEDVDLVAQYADIFQIGARNMQNYRLLEAVGKTKLPVLLKRGIASSVKELLAAADYILMNGNKNVVLCERGIASINNSGSSFSGTGYSPRYMLDIAAIPIIESFSHLPVIVDPSHAAGNFALVPALARAGIAAGADGLLIEVHPRPEKALCDEAQQLAFPEFKELMKELKKIAAASGRTI